MSKWISVSDDLPGFGKKVLVYWRPIDHEQRPYHREIVIAERTVYSPDGEHSYDSKWWWSNGRHYDTDTFITHWMELPGTPDETCEICGDPYEQHNENYCIGPMRNVQTPNPQTP